MQCVVREVAELDDAIVGQISLITAFIYTLPSSSDFELAVQPSTTMCMTSAYRPDNT